MTHNFFLNLMTVFFPLLCLILAFVPEDFNHYINVVARWIYKKFNVDTTRQQTFALNPVALRAFGIIGLVFTIAIILLIFYKPSA